MKCFAFVFLLLGCFSEAQNLMPNSTGSFNYTPDSPLNNQTVEVFYHIPNGDLSTMPILFSFHGASRNADDYRDYWISMANANGFMVFAPEFSNANFPGGDAYQLANIFDDGDNPSSGSFNSVDEWTFSIIDPLFDYIKTDISGLQEVYDAWGHSGGAQFLHRFVMYLPDSHLNTAVCSNAGWYTVPEFSVDFPYGLQLGELPNADLIDAFSKTLIIHLGQNDTDPNAPGLRHNTVVDNQQGLHRLERGQYFYNTSLITSQDLNATYNWEKHEVAGIGHQAQLMANDALQYLPLDILNTFETKKDQMKLYPNPLKNQSITIEGITEGSSFVAIYDTLGKKVFEKTFTGKHLNIPSLKSGMYVFKITNGKNVHIQKIMVM
ncbi:MAG: T9SS type A sorting domain-containing protein [Algicola sp.]|nr:T9SS type A sorting domain-containing protein [Algicola sp.]